MDIFRFINSEDIRKHLINLNYDFTPVEAAWLVWKCETITLKERHKAWQEIIDTMPDCSVNEEQGIESLHMFLKDYMENENQLLEVFFKNESNAEYQGKGFGFYTWWEASDPNSYKDFDTCFSGTISEDIFKDFEIEFVLIEKSTITEPSNLINVLMDKDKKIYRVNYNIFTCREFESAFNYMLIDDKLKNI